MTLFDFKALVVNNTFGNFYIFHGVEYGVKTAYIRKLAEIRNLSIVYLDDLESAWREIGSNSLFGGGCLYVCSDFSDLKRIDMMAWQDYIRNGMVIMVDDKAGKGRKEYAEFTVHFTQLSDDILNIYIKNRLKTGERFYLELMDACNHDYNYLMFELDKIEGILATNEINVTALLHELLNRKDWFFTDARDVIFILIDKIMGLEIKSAFGILKEAFEGGEHPLVILSLLESNLLNLLRYIGASVKSMEATGLNYPQWKNCQKYVGLGWNARETLRVFNIVRDLEMCVKSGKIEPYFAIEYLLTRIDC